MSQRDITDDVKINRYKLEEAAEEQSFLYYHYSELLNDARRVSDEKKLQLKKTLASIELRYRSGDLEIGEGVKLTEGSINAAVETNPDVIEAKRELMEADTAVNRAQSAEEAIRMRKSMVQNLVQLYTMQYYSSPSGKKALSDDMAEDYRDKINHKRKGEDE